MILASPPVAPTTLDADQFAFFAVAASLAVLFLAVIAVSSWRRS